MPHKTKSPGKGGKRRHAGQRVKVKKQVADSKNSPPRKSSRVTKRKAKRLKSKETLKKETIDSQNSVLRRSARLASRRYEEIEERSIEEGEITNVKRLSIRIEKDEKTAADRHLPSLVPSSDFSKKTRGKGAGYLQNVIANDANPKTKVTRKLVVQIKDKDKTAAEKHLRDSIPSTSSRKEGRSPDTLPNIMEGTSTSVKGNVGIDPDRLISTPIPSDGDLKRKSLSISPIRSSKPDVKKFKVESSDESPNSESTEKPDMKKLKVESSDESPNCESTEKPGVKEFKVESSDETPNCESTDDTIESNTKLDDEWDKIAPDENKYNEAKKLDLVSELGDTHSNSDFDHESSKTIIKDRYSTFIDTDYDLERNNIIMDTKNKEETSFENALKLSNEDQNENVGVDRKEIELLTSTPIANIDHKRKKSPSISPIESTNPVKSEVEKKSS